MHIRVLLVDDFDVVREGLAHWLGRDPAIEVVGQAADGAEGVALALATRPDVVLLDMHLPTLGGLEVLERLHAELPATRVIVMSASQRSETVLAAMGGGAAGYLTKRTTREELVGAVITVHGGGSVIAPAVAVHLVERYRRAARGEGDLRSVLSPRERSVLSLVARGRTDLEIAGEIHVSPRTVQNHLAAIRDKLGLRRRAELTRWAVEHAAA